MSTGSVTGTERSMGSSYMKWRSRINWDTDSSTDSTWICKWGGQAQSTQISGYGIKISVAITGYSEDYSGSRTGSDTGVVSDTTTFKTDASTSGTFKLQKGHSSQTVTLKGTASGATVSGHSEVRGDSSVASKTFTVPALDSYTIKYSSNGGSGTVSSQTKWYGESLTLRKGSDFSKTGYTLSGWKNSHTGNVLSLGGNFTGNYNATMIAVWSAHTYTVKFNANGGSGSSYTQKHTYGSSLALTANSFTRTGYTFSGWATSSTGAVKYSNKQSVSNLTSSNGVTINLYAIWTPITYSVVYNKNGGSGTTATSTHTYDKAQALTANGYSRTGYTFQGWATSTSNADKGTVSYTNKQSVKNLRSTSGTYTLYAVWKINTYTIKYDANGGTISSSSYSSKTFNYGAKLTFPSVSRTGYTLKGWFTEKTGGTQVTTSTLVTGGKTLYAQWVVNADVETTKLQAYKVYRQDTSSDYTITDFISDVRNGGQPTYSVNDGLTEIYGYLKFSPSIGTATISNVTSGTEGFNVTGYDIAGNSTEYIFFVANTSTMEVDKSYTFTVTYTIGGVSYTANIVSRGKTILIDIDTINGLTVGIPTILQSTLSVSGNSVLNTLSVTGGSTFNGTSIFNSPVIRQSDSGSVGVAARRTDNGMSSISLLVGTGGINHGLYSSTMDKWLVYSDQNNLHIGNSTTSIYPLGINCTNMKLTTGGDLTLSGQVQNFFKIVEVKCALDAISAHSSQAPKNYTISPGTGYTAVGIVGWSSDRYNVIPYCPRVTGATTLRAGFVNTGNGTSSSGNMDIFVLCIKGSLNGSYPS